MIDHVMSAKWKLCFEKLLPFELFWDSFGTMQLVDVEFFGACLIRGDELE